MTSVAGPILSKYPSWNMLGARVMILVDDGLVPDYTVMRLSISSLAFCLRVGVAAHAEHSLVGV